MQHRRGPVAKRPNEQPIGNRRERQTDDEAAGQVALLVEGDEHVMRHAVDKAQGNGPDEQLQGNGRIGQVLRAADEVGDRVSQKRDSHREGQGDDDQHLHRQRVGPRQRIFGRDGVAAHKRKQSDGERGRDDVDSVHDAEGNRCVAAQLRRAPDRFHQRDVNPEKLPGEQVVQHQRVRLADHLLLQRQIRFPAGAKVATQDQRSQDAQREQVDDDRSASQADQPPAQQQRAGAQRRPRDGGDGGDSRRVFHLLVSIEQRRETRRKVAGHQPDGEQRDGPDRLVTQRRVQDGPAGDEQEQQRRGHSREQQPQQGGVDQVTISQLPVAGDLSLEQRVQPKVDENVHRHDDIAGDKGIVARLLLSKDAQSQGDEGGVNQFVE